MTFKLDEVIHENLVPEYRTLCEKHINAVIEKRQEMLETLLAAVCVAGNFEPGQLTLYEEMTPNGAKWWIGVTPLPEETS